MIESYRMLRFIIMLHHDWQSKATNGYEPIRLGGKLYKKSFLLVTFVTCPQILYINVLYFFAATAEKYTCEYGESYWCSNLNYAKACGAVQHCIQNVWSNQILKVKVKVIEEISVRVDLFQRRNLLSVSLEF